MIRKKCSLAPLLRGEGWGSNRKDGGRLDRGESPSPSPGLHLRCDPTSPRKQGEVNQNHFAGGTIYIFQLIAGPGWPR